MEPAEPSQRPGRIDVIDVARGAAMLLVFFSHFLEAYFQSFRQIHPHPLQLATRIATPAFVLISGVTLAVLFARGRDRFEATRDRLLDRGLFLVLVGHPLFAIAHRFIESSWADAFRVVFITDTIGLAVIVGALLITRVGARARLLLGAALLLTGWTLPLTWEPPIPGVMWAVKDFLVGDVRDQWLTYNFPPVPWLGLYLVASAAGVPFARAFARGTERALPLRLTLLGGASAALALALHFVTGALAAPGARAGHVGALTRLGTLTQKLPPSPAYMLFYGGLALVVFAALLLVHRTRPGRAFAAWVSLFGKSSLAAFLFQFYVYYIAVSLLPRPPEPLMPVYFVATVFLLRALVKAWEAGKWNRLITVGYPAFRSRFGKRRPAPAASVPSAGVVAAAAPATAAAAARADRQPIAW
jgi:uncharacterized membrane protein